LNNVVELEEHYQTVHSFHCSECSNKFITSRALDVHIEEEHSQFFAAKLRLYSDKELFECFATPSCSSCFTSKDRRDDHCRQVHHLDNSGRVREDGRKKVADIEKSIRNISISNSREFQFGTEQERMFNRERKKLTAKRVLK
jgi:hypothetical protein